MAIKNPSFWLKFVEFCIYVLNFLREVLGGSIFVSSKDTNPQNNSHNEHKD